MLLRNKQLQQSAGLLQLLGPALRNTTKLVQPCSSSEVACYKNQRKGCGAYSRQNHMNHANLQSDLEQLGHFRLQAAIKGLSCHAVLQPYTFQLLMPTLRAYQHPRHIQTHRLLSTFTNSIKFAAPPVPG